MNAMAPKPRAADDWYVEEPRCTHQLLAVEPIYGLTLDPACGQGNIVHALRELNIPAYGSDIKDRGMNPEWFIGECDFLNWTPVVRPQNIVCNPPFFRGVGTEAFIRRALALATRKVCIFTEARFLFGDGRAATLYSEFPPDRIWIITPRPSCPPGEFIVNGGKVGGGTPDFVWLVWDNDLPISRRGMSMTGWARPVAAKE